MRLNKYIALATGISRRAADKLVESGAVSVNGQPATNGLDITDKDLVNVNGRQISLPDNTQTIIMNKPTGYVCSRDGQGSKTIYDLLPPELHNLKPVGRLDKYSSGLILLTNDGDLANKLTHPSFHKIKIYEVSLDKPLQPLHRQMISEHGVMLEDGASKFIIERLDEGNDKSWRISMHEGRNRQIRRTFSSLGYNVIKLHRTQFGNYKLSVKEGAYEPISGS